MKAVLLRGDTKGPFTIYYSVVARTMSFGVTSDGSGDTAIMIEYDREHAVNIACIVREMQAKGLVPRVYFDLSDPGDVVALFTLQNPSSELLEKVVPPTLVEPLRRSSRQIFLTATGESDFELESLVKYLVPVSRGHGAVQLFIVNNDKDVLVQMKIPLVIQGIPPFV